MKLEEIGFYTMYDKRAENINKYADLHRCELILTDRCNFNCHYCRGLKDSGDIDFKLAKHIVKGWLNNNLKNIRFSGGEPTLYPHLIELVDMCKNIERIALSTNGSQDYSVYKELIEHGVDDFSISLDACCSSNADKMSGTDSKFNTIVDNIIKISKETYVTLGIVIDQDNLEETNRILNFADTLGVSDIRIIPSAQYNKKVMTIPELNYPIYKYRYNNMHSNRNVRGIQKTDSHKCSLVLDDIAVNKDKHYPCIIYMREQGKPIGNVKGNFREERHQWYLNHNSYNDKICRENCIDVCVDYNNKCVKE